MCLMLYQQDCTITTSRKYRMHVYSPNYSVATKVIQWSRLSPLNVSNIDVRSIHMDTPYHIKPFSHNELGDLYRIPSSNKNQLVKSVYSIQQTFNQHGKLQNRLVTDDHDLRTELGYHAHLLRWPQDPGADFAVHTTKPNWCQADILILYNHQKHLQAVSSMHGEIVVQEFLIPGPDLVQKILPTVYDTDTLEDYHIKCVVDNHTRLEQTIKRYIDYMEAEK